VSAQSNIEVVVSPSWKVTFTTSRWTGSAAAKLVQSILREEELPVDAEAVLHCISHHEVVSRPVEKIGNADFPTVIVDIPARRVEWRNEHPAPLITHSWAFGEYADLGEESMEEYYE
jgi:hypothetical protein